MNALFGFTTIIFESASGAAIAFFTLPMFGYLRVLSLFGWAPEAIYFEKYHKEVGRYIRPILATAIFGLLLGIPWDILAIQDGVWYFGNYLNVWFFGIPLEEYLFFFFYALGIGLVTIGLKVHRELHVLKL